MFSDKKDTIYYGIEQCNMLVFDGVHYISGDGTTVYNWKEGTYLVAFLIADAHLTVKNKELSFDRCATAKQ